jgi:hypothetical protein
MAAIAGQRRFTCWTVACENLGSDGTLEGTLGWDGVRSPDSL